MNKIFGKILLLIVFSISSIAANASEKIKNKTAHNKKITHTVLDTTTSPLSIVGVDDDINKVQLLVTLSDGSQDTIGVTYELTSDVGQELINVFFNDFISGGLFTFTLKNGDIVGISHSADQSS